MTFDLPFHYYDGEVSELEQARSIMKFHDKNSNEEEWEVKIMIIWVVFKA